MEIKFAFEVYISRRTPFYVTSVLNKWLDGFGNLEFNVNFWVLLRIY